MIIITNILLYLNLKYKEERKERSANINRIIVELILMF